MSIKRWKTRAEFFLLTQNNQTARGLTLGTRKQMCIFRVVLNADQKRSQTMSYAVGNGGSVTNCLYLTVLSFQWLMFPLLVVISSEKLLSNIYKSGHKAGDMGNIALEDIQSQLKSNMNISGGLEDKCTIT